IYSPDGAHIALALVNVAQKRAAVAIIDSKTQKLLNLPSETQFVRWLSAETILLKGASGLIQYNAVLGTSLPVFQPEGWTVNTIIPETSIQFLSNKNGQFAVKNGGGELQEVLGGTGITRDLASANDFSVFGGVDNLKRFWVQRGLRGRPQVVAE